MTRAPAAAAPSSAAAAGAAGAAVFIGLSAGNSMATADGTVVAAALRTAADGAYHGGGLRHVVSAAMEKVEIKIRNL